MSRLISLPLNISTRHGWRRWFFNFHIMQEKHRSSAAARLKSEGPLVLNMKMMHAILKSGCSIWFIVVVHVVSDCITSWEVIYEVAQSTTKRYTVRPVKHYKSFIMHQLPVILRSRHGLCFFGVSRQHDWALVGPRLVSLTQDFFVSKVFNPEPNSKRCWPSRKCVIHQIRLSDGQQEALLHSVVAAGRNALEGNTFSGDGAHCSYMCCLKNLWFCGARLYHEDLDILE
ncbi:hypothetical protein C5167_024362 [Papaver somniferum]|uniref:Uncharacterized protein n=1 Tax=Papaver somniferum TaxID=3469 RepID=A0A4Y7JND1_PAPSO|nr:hypothetical protein C5167_024362 [Papaver somniferum]